VESEKSRAKRLLDNYNLLIHEWETVAAFQGRVCFGCGLPNTKGKRLATDHDHETGLFRGLLCSKCNALLGKIENAFKRLGMHKVEGMVLVIILRRLSEFLADPPAVRALGKMVFGWAGRIGTGAHKASIKAKYKAASKRVPPPEPLMPRRRGKQ
jgi:Recombination endonuclease VII